MIVTTLSFLSHFCDEIHRRCFNHFFVMENQNWVKRKKPTNFYTATYEWSDFCVLGFLIPYK